MSVGDDIGLTEQLYHEMIGRYVATIEVLTKRLVAKDQHISRLQTESVPPTEEVFYGENPPKEELPRKNRK